MFLLQMLLIWNGNTANFYKYKYNYLELHEKCLKILTDLIWEKKNIYQLSSLCL